MLPVKCGIPGEPSSGRGLNTIAITVGSGPRSIIRDEVTIARVSIVGVEGLFLLIASFD